MTRLEHFENIGKSVTIIEIDAYSHLIDAIESIGWCKSGGMGLIPTPITEINAYTQITGIELSMFELDTLIAMSSTYTYYIQQSKQDAKSPIEEDTMTRDIYDEIMSY